MNTHLLSMSLLLAGLLLSPARLQAETRLMVGAGVTNYLVNTPDGAWWQSDQRHGFDTLSLALKAGLETTITDSWYLGAGYLSLGRAQAWTDAQRDDTFYGGTHGRVDKFIQAVDRVQGGELYAGYRWPTQPLQPYLTVGLAHFWHRVTQTHDTQRDGAIVRAQDISLNGTYLAWRVGGGACYRWLCGEVTYYKGLGGTNFPIATNAVVPMLTLNIPLF